MAGQHFAIDLDGTLCEYRPGMGARGEVGAVLPWAKPFLRKAFSVGDLVTVFTSRDPAQHDAIRAHLFDQLGIRLPVTNIKRPEFTAFIDDRAINASWLFTHDERTALDDSLFGFKPWWEHQHDAVSGR